MNMIAMCGDNCTYCPRYVATESGEHTALEKVKELWVRLGLRDPDSPVEDMACHGCMPENRCAYSGLRACVRARGHENCGVCEGYPCNLIDGMLDQSKKLKSHAVRVCTQEEMEMLHKAFFLKREYFDHIQQKERKTLGTTRDTCQPGASPDRQGEG